MSVIRASVTDQRLKITEAPVLASGGQNETKVAFTFCEKWKGFTKTATFYRDESEVYSVPLDANDICVVPWEVCNESGSFYIGVFGDKDNVRRTSTTVRYRVKNGAITEGSSPSEPTPDRYTQLAGEVESLASELHTHVENCGTTLVVTIDSKGGNASHTPEQIYAHVMAGGTVVAGDENGYKYYHMESSSQYEAVFWGGAYDCTDLTYIVVNEGGSYDVFNYTLAEASLTMLAPANPKVGQFLRCKSAYSGSQAVWETVDLPGEGKYVLIETIPLEGEVVVDKRVEPDGTPYNFTDIIVELYTAPGASATGHFYPNIKTTYGDSVANWGIANAINTEGARYFMCDTHFVKGVVEAGATEVGMSVGSATNYKRRPLVSFSPGGHNLGQIYATATAPFPAGSYLTIKAVRAND